MRTSIKFKLINSNKCYDKPWKLECKTIICTQRGINKGEKQTKPKKGWVSINHNNNNGNFICVFECTIVNLATYRQFTNAAWDWIIKKKKTKTNKKTSKQQQQQQNQNCIKSGLSQFLFLQQKM